MIQPLTHQEMFDKVTLGLAAQGWRQSVTQAKDENDPPQCVYRGPQGLKCAAGQLIPDDKYNPRMEWRGVRIAFDEPDSSEGNSLLYDALTSAGINLCNIEFLAEMQGSHDAYINDTPEQMKLAFRTYAIRYNLTLPEGAFA